MRAILEVTKITLETLRKQFRYAGADVEFDTCTSTSKN